MTQSAAARAGVAAQLFIAHVLLDRLAELALKRESEDAKVAAPARVLCSVREAHRSAPLRPETPLTTTTLLTHYKRREIVAGVGFVKPGKKGVLAQG